MRKIKLGELSETLSMDRVWKLSETLSMDRVWKLSETLSMDRVSGSYRNFLNTIVLFQSRHISFYYSDI
nr:hypothetical protein [Leptospira santarosai]